MTETAESQFNPAFHFLGLIQKAMADGVTRYCKHPACPEVYLVPTENAFYSPETNIESLQALCLAAPFDLSVELLPNWQPDQEVDVQAGRLHITRKPKPSATNLIKYPLEELVWYSTLCASKGRLLVNSRIDIAVGLNTYPDFSSLFHKEHEPMLAAMLLEDALPLPALANLSGVPLAEVIDFHNACAILGYVVTDSGNAFNPANHLLGLLDQANTDLQIRCCKLPGQQPLYIVPTEGKYLTEADATALGKLCAASLSALEVSIVDTSSTEEEVVQIGRTRVRRKKQASLPNLPSHPLSELRFRAALYASQGRLLPGYASDKPVRLKAWPDKALLKDASSIKEERYIFQLAALMTAKAASLQDIAQTTNLPLAQVINFHNACAVMGLVDQIA
ncbi:hypothetical protein JCM14076_04450 [Methylosoma difficile]